MFLECSMSLIFPFCRKCPCFPSPLQGPLSYISYLFPGTPSEITARIQKVSCMFSTLCFWNIFWDVLAITADYSDACFFSDKQSPLRLTFKLHFLKMRLVDRIQEQYRLCQQVFRAKCPCPGERPKIPLAWTHNFQVMPKGDIVIDFFLI